MVLPPGSGGGHSKDFAGRQCGGILSFTLQCSALKAQVVWFLLVIHIIVAQWSSSSMNPKYVQVIAAETGSGKSLAPGPWRERPWGFRSARAALTQLEAPSEYDLNMQGNLGSSPSLHFVFWVLFFDHKPLMEVHNRINRMAAHGKVHASNGATGAEDGAG